MDKLKMMMILQHIPKACHQLQAEHAQAHACMTWCVIAKRSLPFALYCIAEVLIQLEDSILMYLVRVDNLVQWCRQHRNTPEPAVADRKTEAFSRTTWVCVAYHPLDTCQAIYVYRIRFCAGHSRCVISKPTYTLNRRLELDIIFEHTRNSVWC